MNASVRSLFARLWYEWLRIPRPFEHYRQGNRRHQLYGIEVDLDHVDTYVRGWFDMLGEGAAIQASVLRNDIELLAKIEQMLEAKPVTEEEKSRYKQYIDATKNLLESMMRRTEQGS